MSTEKIVKKSYSPMQWFHIVVTFLLMFGFGHLPTFATLTPVGMKVLGVFLGVIYGYSTCEVIWPWTYLLKVLITVSISVLVIVLFIVSIPASVLGDYT